MRNFEYYFLSFSCSPLFKISSFFGSTVYDSKDTAQTTIMKDKPLARILLNHFPYPNSNSLHSTGEKTIMANNLSSPRTQLILLIFILCKNESASDRNSGSSLKTSQHFLCLYLRKANVFFLVEAWHQTIFLWQHIGVFEKLVIYILVFFKYFLS